MNLPNKITILRILLIPIFMVFALPINGLDFLKGYNEFVLNTGMYIATVIFIIASITDFLDGYIARKYNLVTTLGKFLDPIADKLLVTAALIVLVQNSVVSGWAALIILSREFIVTALRVVAAGKGTIIAASKLGKIKTTVQIIAIVLCLLNNFTFSVITTIPIHSYVMALAVIITVYSGYDYVYKNINVFKE